MSLLGRSDIQPAKDKVCEFCGKSFGRKRWSSDRIEDRSSYLRRRFCSMPCVNSKKTEATKRLERRACQ